MSEIKFTMVDVTEKREKISKKGSIYDPIIDKFLETGHDLVEITVEEKRPSYIATMLKKRIQVRELELKATAIHDVVYLEKA